MTRLIQRLRSLATLRTPLQLTRISCKSSWNVYRQIFLGRPLLLLPPSGIHCIATLAGLSDGSRGTCPASVNLLTLTMFVTMFGDVPVVYDGKVPSINSYLHLTRGKLSMMYTIPSLMFSVSHMVTWLTNLALFLLTDRPCKRSVRMCMVFLT